jgi:hypothetical protein
MFFAVFIYFGKVDFLKIKLKHLWKITTHWKAYVYKNFRIEGYFFFIIHFGSCYFDRLFQIVLLKSYVLDALLLSEVARIWSLLNSQGEWEMPSKIRLPPPEQRTRFRKQKRNARKTRTKKVFLFQGILDRSLKRLQPRSKALKPEIKFNNKIKIFVENFFTFLFISFKCLNIWNSNYKNQNLNYN